LASNLLSHKGGAAVSPAHAALSALTRVWLPVHRHIFWNAEWRYVGSAENSHPFYALEGFRRNQL